MGFGFGQDEMERFYQMLFEEGQVVKFARDPDIVEVQPVSYSSERRDAHVARDHTGLAEERDGDVAVD